jgi:DNA-binding transcriptional ArsR family regulator
MKKKPQRLTPTPSVIKKLFAYSGNQCAMPECKEIIVDPSGAMLGKVAHINAAEPGGARYDPKMSDEQRRAFDNLFIVCGKHHDIIDYKENEADYPAEVLRKFKATHEGRFKKAERQLIKQFVDTTQVSQPTYPKHLRALAQARNYADVEGNEEDIRGVRYFIENLKELPLQEREFALKLAERMRRRRRDTLTAEDVMGAFQISADALQRHMKVLEDHQLGDLDEGSEPNSYYVALSDREGDINPWIEILEFCDATGHTPDELIHDLNFALYDG